MKTKGWRRRWECILALAFVVGTAQTCGSGERPGDPDAPFTIEVYLIRPFDRLVLSSVTAPLNVGETTVADDGTITMPDIGKIKVSGLTKSGAEQALYDAYVPDYYTDVRINVEVASLIFYIYGEVKIPGQKQWIKDTTLMQAIISAGGFTDFANRRAVVVSRTATTEDGEEATRNTKYNCARIEAGKVADPQVRPNDKIRVPRKLF